MIIIFSIWDSYTRRFIRCCMFCIESRCFFNLTSKSSVEPLRILKNSLHTPPYTIVAIINIVEFRCLTVDYSTIFMPPPTLERARILLVSSTIVTPGMGWLVNDEILLVSSSSPSEKVFLSALDRLSH